MTTIHYNPGRADLPRRLSGLLESFSTLDAEERRPPNFSLHIRLISRAGRCGIGTTQLPLQGTQVYRNGAALSRHPGLHTDNRLSRGGGSGSAHISGRSQRHTQARRTCALFLSTGPWATCCTRVSWHSDRLPLYGPGSKMVIITDEETSQDLRDHGSMSDPVDQRGGWKLNRIVDFQHTFGLTFEILL